MGRDPYDKRLSDLIGELSTRSEEFRVPWAPHDVKLHRAGTKRFHIQSSVTSHSASFVMAQNPCWMCQRRMTCGGVLPYLNAKSTIVGSWGGLFAAFGSAEVAASPLGASRTCQACFPGRWLRPGRQLVSTAVALGPGWDEAEGRGARLWADDGVDDAGGVAAVLGAVGGVDLLV